MKDFFRLYGSWVPFFYLIGFVFLISYLFIPRPIDVSGEISSFLNVSPTHFTPIVAYIGLAFAYITIKNTQKINREKNTLDFDKVMSDEKAEQAIRTIYRIKNKKLNHAGELNRKEMVRYINYMIDNYQDIKSSLMTKKREKEIKDLYKELKDKQDKDKMDLVRLSRFKKMIDDNNEKKEYIEVYEAIQYILNTLELSANAVRYGIYDEEIMYSIYGSQVIAIYEVCFGYIKRRQINGQRLFMNIEWLAMKWTIQRAISGNVSNRLTKTNNVLKHANKALNEHLKACDVDNLKKHLKKIEALRTPD